MNIVGGFPPELMPALEHLPLYKTYLRLKNELQHRSARRLLQGLPLSDARTVALTRQLESLENELWEMLEL